MSPRILILSASVGTGHLRAAQAVHLALEQSCPDAVIANVDVLDFINAAFRRIYGKSYFDLVGRAPHLVGYLYDRLDQTRGRSARRMDRVRSGVQRMNLRRLADLIIHGRWDLAINTHFLPAEIIATLRSEGRVDLPQLTVTTDFDTHRMWVNQPCEHYFTATEEGRVNLAASGVALENITASGVPIHSSFINRQETSACRRRLDLATDRPIVLQLAGGFGFGPVEQLHRRLLEVELPLEIVTIAGKNPRLRERLESIPAGGRHRRRVLGFTSEMASWMTAADVVVSKPGGLTASEAMACGLPMAIVHPIPGQEDRNSDMLLESGAAVKIHNLASMAHKLTTLLRDPQRLASMRAAALRIARPRAAFDIATHALEMLSHNPILAAGTDRQLPRFAPPPSDKATAGTVAALKRRVRRTFRSRLLTRNGS